MFNIKPRLCEKWQKKNMGGTMYSILFSFLRSYKDMWYTGRTHTNAKKLRALYILHALDNVFRANDRIIRNNAILLRDKKKREESKSILDKKDKKKKENKRSGKIFFSFGTGRS